MQPLLQFLGTRCLLPVEHRIVGEQHQEGADHGEDLDGVRTDLRHQRLALQRRAYDGRIHIWIDPIHST